MLLTWKCTNDVTLCEKFLRPERICVRAVGKPGELLWLRRSPTKHPLRIQETLATGALEQLNTNVQLHHLELQQLDNSIELDTKVEGF